MWIVKECYIFQWKWQHVVDGDDVGPNAHAIMPALVIRARAYMYGFHAVGWIN